MTSRTSLLSCLSLAVLTALFGRIISDSSFSRDNLRNIVLDEENGVLYLGGDKVLYKLRTDNLSILNSVDTCGSCYSKILLKTKNNTLIVCGVDDNGKCALYHASNLTSVLMSNVSSGLFLYGNQNKTAVGLLNSEGTDLYVGLTYSQEANNILPYYIISNRDTDSTSFNIIAKDSSGVFVPRGLKIKENIKNSYLIYFRAVFQTKTHVYFLTNQRFQNHIDSPYVSKLIRICNYDESFYSYIDLELECKNTEGDKFNLVQHGDLIELGDKLSTSPENQALVATFAAGIDPENPWSNRSAICLYTLKEIQERIIEAQTRIVSKCDNGRMVYNESFTYIDVVRSPTGPPCRNESFVKEYMSCNTAFELYRTLTSFDTKLTSTAIFTANDILLGKIAGSSLAEGYSELLVGTDKGNVKKLALFNTSMAVQYDTLNVDSGQPVEAIHRGKDVDYILTSKKLVKVIATNNCSKYLTCDECQASYNPHCGWCILEEKCSTMKSCSTTENNTFISTPEKCISMLISPKASFINTNTPLKIRLFPFPSVENGTYKCIFRIDGNNISADVEKREIETLYCTSPKVAKHTLAELDICVTKNNQATKLTSLPFLFYNCSNFSRCKNCTSESDGGCNWCVSTNTVMCSNNVSCSKFTYGQAESCPQLLDNRGTLFVANNVTSTYIFNAKNLPDVGSYKCNLPGAPIITALISRTNTSILNLVKCMVVITDVANAKENRTIELLYPNNHPVDDEYGNTVEVYRCDMLGPDCSQCRAYEANINGPYQCRWCNNSRSSAAGCFHNTKCGNQSVPCGPPAISSVNPKDGPIGGGTVITIEGKNFGISANEIDYITVSGINCQIIKFDVVGKVTCVIKSSVNTTSGPIIISVLGLNSSSNVSFTFKYPNITDVYPTTGPMAGGTEITLIGTNLFIGNGNQNIGITISDGTKSGSCSISKKEDGRYTGRGDKIICKTPTMDKMVAASISVIIDNQTFKAASHMFSYLQDPEINGIFPNKSMASGGIKLTIAGKYLNNTHAIRIEMLENSSTSVPCILESNTKMICPTPELSEDQKKKLVQVKSNNRKRRSIDESCFGYFEIVIKMDGFESKFTLSYTVDPSLLDLTGDNLVHVFFPSKSRTITLKGSNLLWESTDINISIGYEKCAVVEVTESSISCTPPLQQPRTDQKYPNVLVQIGNYKKTVGYLKYEIETMSNTGTIVIAIIAVVLLLALIMVTIIYLRKGRHLGRKADEFQKQIQDLEMEIRNVSREEFANLQTSIKEVTSSLVKRGFPYRDYQYYSFRMLFPTADMETHPVMLDPQVSDDMRIRLKKGMDMLQDLLFNKFFLKSLIQTMERQPQTKFSQRERANFSSVLSIVLLGKMEYFYKILKMLLPDLVEVFIYTKSHETLFTRCESMTEKLLMNLFSLCLYPYLKKHGSSLYMMLKAIQIRMEKGPIDQLTAHAKYTLSEDQLLKKHSTTGSELVLESKPLVS